MEEAKLGSQENRSNLKTPCKNYWFLIEINIFCFISDTVRSKYELICSTGKLMKNITLFLSFTLISLYSGLALSDGNFAKNYRLHLSNSEMAPIIQKKIVKKFEYVFIAGFLNEGLLGYFKDNKKALLVNGVPKKQIHIINPSSNKGLSQNIPLILKKLKEIRNLKKKKLIIIAHSKGAAETLGLAMLHSDFIENNVHKIYLVQGALKGSGVADYIQGVGPAMSKDAPLKARLWFYLAGRTARAMDPIINKGITSITHEYAKNYWEDIFNKVGAPSNSLSQKIGYITSYEHPKKMSDVVDCTGWYLHTSFGKNDGLVELKDQYFKNFGNLLIVMKADHTDLMTFKPLSNVSKNVRFSLMEAILTDL